MKPYPSEPEPEEQPTLIPPARRPPTAIGTATPPPPERPEKSDYGDRLPLPARIGAGLLGSLFVAGGGQL